MSEQVIQRGFLKGALILTIAGILAKILSALYRVPFQNIAGDIGYYVYQQVYPFYGISFALALYGFPVAISKLISEEKHMKLINKHEVIFLSSVMLGIIFPALFLLVYFGSHSLSQFLRDPHLVPTLKAVSYSFLLLPAISLLRGIHQGRENMLPTAASQILEQLSRVSFILIVCSWVGMQNGSPYTIGTGAAYGGLAGGLAAIITLLFFSRKRKEFCFKSININVYKAILIGKRVLLEGIAIAISATMLILFQFIDTFQIPILLAESNLLSDTIKWEKGVFDRGQPLLQLGIVVATSISLSLVPHISKAFNVGDWESITNSAVTTLKIGIVLGGAASVGLAIIIEPTNIMLFKDQSGSILLGVLGISILFATIALIGASILQGIGKTNITTRNILIGCLVKVILNIVMLSQFGMIGAAISTVAGVASIALLNIVVLFKSVPQIAKKRFYSIRILLALVIMAIITFLWKHTLIEMFPYYTNDRLVSLFIAMSSALVGLVSYFICFVFFPIWNQSEHKQLPDLIRLISRVEKRKEQNG